MKIKLLHNYKGSLSNYEKLLAGEHELENSLAQYLVDNGHAVVVATQESRSETALEVSKLPELSPLAERRTRYKELSGKTATPKWDIETLEAKISQLEGASA